MSSNLNLLKGRAVFSCLCTTASAIFLKRNCTKRIATIFIAIFIIGVNVGVGQTTVTYTMQTGNFNSLNTERNNNPPYAGTYNNGATELAQYANGGSFNNTPGAAAFQTFTTTGVGSGTARTLRVGDKFTITGFVSANPSAGGYIGVSFRASTTYTNFFSSTDGNTVARFQLDNTGNWKVYSGSSTVATSTSGANADRTFTLEVTSSNTFNATIGSETFYDLSFGTTGPISSFAIYSFGDNNQNSFWKNASLTNFGHSSGDGIRLGYNMASSDTRTNSGTISDGQNTNTTSGTLANKVLVGGPSGSQLNLNADNTHTGTTTINANAQGEVQHANALGATSASTTVTSGGSLKLFSASSLTIAAEPLTINGFGLNLDGIDLGALRSVGGTNTWTGNITLAGSSRINADISGGAGSLSITGNVNCGANTLYLGSRTSSLANISISGEISGTGGSICKDFGSTLTLTGQNSYTGNTTVSAGTLQLNRTGGTTIPNSNDINVSGGTLKVSQNQELDDLTISSGGTLIIDAGVTLTINGVFTGGGTIQNNGSLILKGNSTFPGASSTITSMTNLNINRAAGVTLDKDITITGTLTLTSGKLTTGNNTLYISNSATNALSGGSSSSYIVGNLKRAVAGTGNYVFPIGTSNNYSEASITFTTGYISADLTATYDATSVTTINSPLTSNGQSLIGALNGGFWTITPSAATGSPVYNITINKTDYTNSQGNSNVYTIIKRVTGSGNSWTVQGSHVGNASPLTGTTITSTRNGLTSFSDFTIAYSGSPLPVTFTSLTGNIRNGQAQLNWTIADEHNVDHYQVEESVNGRQFQSFTQVDAASRSSYQTIDAQLHTGANYYRVKAVDIDGKLTYSKIIRLENSAIDQQIRVYPNPSQGELTLGLNIAAGNYQIRVINAVGQIVLQQPLTHEGGSRSLPLALPKLNAGIYQLEVRGGMQKYVRSVRID